MTIDYTDISSVDVDGDINATGVIGSSKQGKVVGTLATMPTASVDYDGITVQYTGATSGGYVHNAFYRCGSNGQGGYAWTKVTSGDDTAGSLTHPIYMNAGVPTPTTYELNAAGARGVDTAVTDGSANLPTSDAVHDYVKDSTIAIKTSGGTTVGDFSLNQASNEAIVLPASAMQFNDRSVTFSLQSAPDFADYPYRAQFAVTGITADDYAEVTFSPAQVASGYYAPFCRTDSGYVYLYANANVGTVNVPTISVGNYESNPDHSDPAWDAKLSKIESAGLRAYTHNGAEQGDIAVTSASTANTIMQRDASGSTQVADTPTDTHSAVNQAYVESTVDGVNNLVHKSGAETIAGTKVFSDFIKGRTDFVRYVSSGTNGGKWVKLGTLASNMTAWFMHISESYGIVMVSGQTGILYMKSFIAKNAGTAEIKMVRETDGTCTVWWKHIGNYHSTYVQFATAHRYGGGTPDYFTPSTDDTVYDSPVVGEGATEITAVETFDPTVVHITDAETIAGVKTFSSSPVVPDTPANTHSAVNQAYVESTVDGVNNLFHKSANEKGTGSKSFVTSSFINNKWNAITHVTNNVRGWIKCCKIAYKTDCKVIIDITTTADSSDRSFDITFILNTNGNSPYAIIKRMTSGVESFVNINNFVILNDTENLCFYVYVNTSAITTYYGMMGKIESWIGRNSEVKTINDTDIVWYVNTVEDPSTLTDLTPFTIQNGCQYKL